DDMDIDAAIMLGMDALYNVTEGKINASTLEVGVITADTKKFKKFSYEEVENYVNKELEKHKGESPKGSEEE
ncbi:MAG: proteasome subunit alpha, partial [Methanohalobium sp.]